MGQVRAKRVPMDGGITIGPFFRWSSSSATALSDSQISCHGKIQNSSVANDFLILGVSQGANSDRILPLFIGA